MALAPSGSEGCDDESGDLVFPSFLALKMGGFIEARPRETEFTSKKKRDKENNGDVADKDFPLVLTSPDFQDPRWVQSVARAVSVGNSFYGVEHVKLAYELPYT